MALYGCETSFLILREECRLTVFEKRSSMRIFGPKRDENGEWRRLHIEELHSSCRSPNEVRGIYYRRLRGAGHVARMEEVRSAALKMLIPKPTRNRPLGRPRRRWESNIRMDLEEIGVSMRNWIDSPQ